MLRAPALIAAVAAFGLLAGGAVWLRASLASAFAKGEAHGRAVAAAESATAIAAMNASLDAVRRGAEQEAAALETERDELREKLDDLETMLGPAVGGAAAGVAPCLDAGVVRALDAIRRSGAATP